MPLPLYEKDEAAIDLKPTPKGSDNQMFQIPSASPHILKSSPCAKPSKTLKSMRTVRE